MGDFEEKLNAILSDPGAMAQIAGLAQSLDLGSILGGQKEPPTPSESPTNSSPPLDHLGDLAGLGDLLGQIDTATITRLLPLVKELTHPERNNERTALLQALRPFLRPERQEKVERALKTAHLLHVGKQLLITMGDSHV